MLLLVGAAAGGAYALGLGPFARPAAEPTPILITLPPATPTPGTTTPAPATEAATPAATPPATAGPTEGLPTEAATGALPTEPAATGTAGATGDPAAQVLSHVPEPLRATCTPAEETGGGLAAVTCSISGDDGGTGEAFYSLFESPEAMNASYDAALAELGLQRDTGSCDEDSVWPGEGVYTIGGQDAGRVGCYETAAATRGMVWTDDRINVLSRIESSMAQADLYDFWVQEAGPNL